MITVKEISSNPAKYYGKEIKGYDCPNINDSNGWLLFYSDSNIYIITKYYTDDKPIETNMYIGNEPNTKYANYMLDKKEWNGYVGPLAKYASGGPTIEMYTDSYNIMYPDSKIDIIFDETGYLVKTPSEKYFHYEISCINSHNGLYVIESCEKNNGMWLASQGEKHNEDEYNYNMLYVNHKRCLGICALYNKAENVGFRPLVCLNENLEFEEETDGSLRIVC